MIGGTRIKIPVRERERFLPEIPRVEKAWRIICWIMSGVTGVAEAGAKEDMEDESIVPEVAVTAW